MTRFLNEIWARITDFLPTKDVNRLQQVNKSLFTALQYVIKQRGSKFIQGPRFYSRISVLENIEFIMRLAKRGILPDIHQQQWVLELVLSTQNQDYIDIVKSTFTLIPQMYHVCIWLIQEGRKEGVGILAAEFMQYLCFKGILMKNLPETLDGKTVQEIMASWFPVNIKASENFSMMASSGDFEECQQLLLRYGGHIDVNYNRILMSTAIGNGRLDVIQWLLEQPGIDINQELHGFSALSAAIIKHRYSIVQLLLQFPGIDINQPGDRHTTPGLILAMEHCGIKADEHEGAADIFYLLLQHPKRDNINVKDDTGKTALIAACESRYDQWIIKPLLECPGIDVNQADRLGRTALITASDEPDNIETVRLLLERPDLDVNRADESGKTALIIAASHRKMDLVRLLLQRPDLDVNGTDNMGRSAFTIAYKDDKWEMSLILLEHPSFDVNRLVDGRKTMLTIAIFDGKKEMVAILLDHPNIDINRADDTGVTALIVATCMRNVEIFRILLQHPNMNVNLSDNEGKTALIYAAERGNMDMFRILLEHPGINFDPGLLSTYAVGDVLSFVIGQPGFDVDQLIKDGHGVNALLNASKCGNLGFATLLLDQHKIDVNQSNESGTTALMMACWKGHPDVVDLLIQYPGIDVNLEDEQGYTALTLALKGYCVEMVKSLLNHPEMDINYRSKRTGETALMAACKRGDLHFVKLLLAYRRANMDQPVIDLNQVDHEGDTALIWACRSNPFEVATWLTEQPGIDLTIRNKKGETAMSIITLRRSNFYGSI